MPRAAKVSRPQLRVCFLLHLISGGLHFSWPRALESTTHRYRDFVVSQPSPTRGLAADHGTRRAGSCPRPRWSSGPCAGSWRPCCRRSTTSLALENPDAILRRAVEVAREKIGLVARGDLPARRIAQDDAGHLGHRPAGRHRRRAPDHVLAERRPIGRRSAARARRAPTSRSSTTARSSSTAGAETRVAGRGWTAWTPILSAHAPIGMLFNDAGLSGAPVDEIKQAHAAILCSLLGTILDPVRGVPGAGGGDVGETKGRRLVTAAVAMLAEDPTMEAREIARRLRGQRRLVRPRLQGGDGDVAGRVPQPPAARSRRRAARRRAARRCLRRRWRPASAATPSSTACFAASAA